jgi:hypothetical protein
MIREGRIKPASMLAMNPVKGGSMTFTSDGVKSKPIPIKEWSASTCDIPVDDAERRTLATSFIKDVRRKAIAGGMSDEDFDAELARIKTAVVENVSRAKADAVE